MSDPRGPVLAGEQGTIQMAAKSSQGVEGPAKSAEGPSQTQASIKALTNRIMNFVESLALKQNTAQGLDPPTAASSFKSPTQAARSGDNAAPSSADPSGSNFKEIKALEAAAAQIGERVYIMFPNVSFFGSASTEITGEGRQVLERFSKVYMPFAGKTVINIVGFADERAVRPIHRFRDNLELSALRAVSAQRVLEGMGIPLNRTRLMGHGIKSQLLPDEQAQDLSSRWALSRKIMLVIEPEGT